MWGQSWGWCQVLPMVAILGSGWPSPTKTKCRLVITLPHSLSPEFCFGKHWRFFSFYCLLVFGSCGKTSGTFRHCCYGTRDHEGEAERKVQEKYGDCWEPLPSCLGIYSPKFSKQDLASAQGLWPSWALSLHSVFPFTLQPPAWAWWTSLHSSWSHPSFTLYWLCRETQLCKHQRQREGEETQRRE